MAEQQTLPPAARTAVWQGINTAAESAEFVLQVCQHCKAIQYPPRELCKDCLEDGLEWKKVAATGKLISCTILHASTNAFFREHLPRRIALVKLDCGPILFAHLAYAGAKSGDRVYVLNRRDRSGAAVFIALVEAGGEQLQLTNLSTLLWPDKSDD